MSQQLPGLLSSPEIRPIQVSNLLAAVSSSFGGSVQLAGCLYSVIEDWRRVSRRASSAVIRRAYLVGAPVPMSGASDRILACWTASDIGNPVGY